MAGSKMTSLISPIALKMAKLVLVILDTIGLLYKYMSCYEKR